MVLGQGVLKMTFEKEAVGRGSRIFHGKTGRNSPEKAVRFSQAQGGKPCKDLPMGGVGGLILTQ